MRKELNELKENPYPDQRKKQHHSLRNDYSFTNISQKSVKSNNNRRG